MIRPLLFILVGSLIIPVAVIADAAPQKEVWMMPPGPGPQEPPSTVALRDFLLHPDDWKQTRAAMTAKTVGVFGSTVYKMNKAFSPDEMHQFGQMLGGWNIKFGLEIESVKVNGGWTTGQEAFDKQRGGWDGVQKAGLPIYSMAMDEPYCSVCADGHHPMEPVVQETANFIALVHKNYPNTKIGDIEPLPSAFSVPLLLAWVDAVQAKLKEMHEPGMDFFRLDFDWTHEIIHDDDASWREVKQLENGLRQRHIPFSFVYWAPPFSFYQRMGLADDNLWYTFVMYQGYAYALVNGDPDQYVLESWIGTPSTGTPETDPNSFSRSVLDFCNKFVVKPHPPSGL